MRRLRRGLLLATTALMAACGGGADSEQALSDAAVDGADVPAPSSSTASLSTTASPSAVVPTTMTAPVGFTGEIQVLDEVLLGTSWRAECPVGPSDLRLLIVAHHDLNGIRRLGEMVVHAEHAVELMSVFEALYDAEFPIERMELITAFGADDVASMRANNSSAFNCRVVDGTSRWSQHAYGTAIDINPLINPWVRGSTVDPPEGAAHLDREADTPGLIHADDLVVQAFESIGWSWGGYWTGSVDYQHFSANGK